MSFEKFITLTTVCQKTFLFVLMSRLASEFEAILISLMIVSSTVDDFIDLSQKSHKQML